MRVARFSRLIVTWQTYLNEREIVFITCFALCDVRKEWVDDFCTVNTLFQLQTKTFQGEMVRKFYEGVTRYGAIAPSGTKFQRSCC